MKAAATRAAGQRLMADGYAKALRVFADGPATWHAVAERCGASRSAAQVLCHGLHRQGLIYVSAWEAIPCGYRKQWTPSYSLGPGHDAPPPVPMTRQAKRRTPSELLAFVDLVRALGLDSWHGAGLAKHLGQSVRSVRATLRTLHALRLVYIDDYMVRPKAGAGYPLYTWGVDQPDAKKPRPMSDRALWTRHNAIASARRQQVSLLHGVVRGVSLDGRRRAANRDEPEVAA